MTALPDPALLLGFSVAVTVLMLIPGPNVALIVANSMAYGPRFGLITVAGTVTAQVAQLTLTALGLTETLGLAGAWFAWLRWIGVVYLLWLGVAQWRAPPVDLARARPEPKSARAIFLRALLVSATNPKTLLFYGAFFPQFISPGREIGPQVAVLAALFLVIAIVVDSGWSFAAGRARSALASSGQLRNRISGGALIGAGAVLALVRTK